MSMQEGDTGDDLGTDHLRRTLEENLGLSPYETDVYLTLVRGGKQSMKAIADASDVPKQRVYDIVEELQSEGFVEVVDEYPKRAYAIDPIEALTPVKDRLDEAQIRLEQLHEAVEEVEGGVALFKSKTSILKYIRRTIAAADDSLFVLAPRTTLEYIEEDLKGVDESVQTSLIISNLRKEHIDDDHIAFDHDVIEHVDRVRGIKSDEAFVLSADRNVGFFWTVMAESRMTDESQGFHVTNPELAFLFDRFLSDSVWPLAKDLQDRHRSLAFPQTYVRMKDCLDDLKRATRDRSTEAFEVEIEGYATDTREEIRKRGTLTGFYYSEYDMRAYLYLEVADERTNGRKNEVTVGGWKSTLEDYEARRLTVRERSPISDQQPLNEETRHHVQTCADALPETLTPQQIVFGFDGFVDSVREAVESRSGPTSYEPTSQLEAFGDRITTSAAGGSSCTIEWVNNGTRTGGHTAHLGRVFSTLGWDPVLVGTFGQPIQSEFEREFDDHTLLSIGRPTYTDAVEFDDGKLMLTDTGTQPTLDWATIHEEVGLETLAEHVDGATLLGVGYWAMIPSMPSIWDGLASELWPLLDDPPEIVLIDTADIRQLATERLENGIETLRTLCETVPVTVSANRAEVLTLARLFDEEQSERSLESAARLVREEIGAERVVGHSSQRAALATDAESVAVQVPHTDNPEMTTSAGDHFNAGLALGLLHEMPEGAALVVANAVAGHFVRTGAPPTYEEIRDFVSSYERAFETPVDINDSTERPNTGGRQTTEHGDHGEHN